MRKDYEVNYSYNPGRTFGMDRQLQGTLCEPPCLDRRIGLPYHLDARHAKILSEATKGMSVLEVGCGGGQMRRWTRDMGLNYFGSDVNPVPFDEELRVHGGPDFVSDAHFLPVRDGSVDLVYSSAVTEHLACPVLAFQNVFRVLKPGGYFLGNCSFLEIWHANSFFHMTPLGLIEVLTCAGFEIDYVWPERGYSVFEAAVRMAFRGPLRCVLPIAALLSRLYKLQMWLRARKHQLTNTGFENPLMDEARVAGAVAFIARKPMEVATGLA